MVKLLGLRRIGTLRSSTPTLGCASPHIDLDHAGKLLGLCPWGPQGVELQRALTKVVSVPLVMQPPVPQTAVHVLQVLAAAEAAASEAPDSQQRPFITFDDTFIKYTELLTHRPTGEPLAPPLVLGSVIFWLGM